MATFLDLKTQVSAEISRGTQLDAYILRRANMAIRWIERNYNMQYMERYASFTVPAAAKSVSIPTRMKSVEFMRRLKDNGEWQFVTQRDARDVLSENGDYPQAWWLDGQQYFRFDTGPKVDTDYELSYYQFSADLVNDTDTHWLIDNAFDLMLWQTLIYMSSIGKMFDSVPLWKDQRDEAIRTVNIAEDMLMNSGRNESMVYKGGT